MEPVPYQGTPEHPAKKPRLSGIKFSKYSDSVPQETVLDEVTQDLRDPIAEVDEHGILQFKKNATASKKGSKTMFYPIF